MINRFVSRKFLTGFYTPCRHILDVIQGFKGSRVQGFKGSRVQGFKGSRVQGFKGSRVQGFKGSRVQGFKGSRVQGFKGSRASSFPAGAVFIASYQRRSIGLGATERDL